MKKILAPIAVWLLAASTALAVGDARKILLESESRHRSRTQEYAGELSVVTKDGRVRKKKWRSWREGYAGDARNLIRFLEPPEVRGVGFLSLGRPGKNPDQWLYLPSMKRERRIASQDRDASFVGTDFSYEDMEDFDHAKYDVDWLREEPCGTSTCSVIEAKPKEKSSYERKILWIRTDTLYVVRVDSFRKGEKEPWKRLALEELAQVDGHWVAKRMEMSDLRKGSRTTVRLEELAFDRAQPADRFTIQNLLRED